MRRETQSLCISDLNRERASVRWRAVHSAESRAFSPDERLMARLCGFLAGDGSIQVRTEKNGKTHHSVEFFPDDHSLIAPFLEAMESIYHKTPSILGHDRHFRIRLFSKSVAMDLLNKASFGIKTWRVPVSLLRRRTAKVEWLRAFFDSEAHVGANSIRVQVVNGIGLAEVRTLLAGFGIISSVYEYQPKKAGWSKVYILIISKTTDRKKFLKHIGFNHGKKQRRLMSSLSSAEVA